MTCVDALQAGGYCEVAYAFQNYSSVSSRSVAAYFRHSGYMVELPVRLETWSKLTGARVRMFCIKIVEDVELRVYLSRRISDQRVRPKKMQVSNYRPSLPYVSSKHSFFSGRLLRCDLRCSYACRTRTSVPTRMSLHIEKCEYLRIIVSTRGSVHRAP